MSWYHKYIHNPTTALNESKQYMDAIFLLYLIPQNKNCCAIFSKLDENTGGMHYYFTPATKTIALSFSASICNKPSKTEIGGLLVGDVTLIDRLYP